MIISLHIPKTGGQSFRARLEDTFGPRILIDYGDWFGFDSPDAIARRARRRLETRARSEELLRDYDIIHGHFDPNKYIGLFPEIKFAATFRDPYQQVLSHYPFFLRHPEIDHPGIREFHERQMDLLEFIAAFPNLQSRFLGHLSVDDLAVVGLTEQYERSVALFEAVFGLKLAPESRRENVNPDHHESAYAVDESARRAVEFHRARDLEVYRLARERFERLNAKYGL